MLRIAFISDLHYAHSRGKYYLDYVVDAMNDIVKPDFIVLGGDISDTVGGFRQVLATVSNGCRKACVSVVAGNHDLWYCNWYSPWDNDPMPEHSSDDIFFKQIPDICRDTGCIYLEDEPEVLDEYNTWGMVGTIGWYDYSSKYPYEPFPNKFYKKNKSNYNNDGRFIQSKYDDEKLSEWCLQGLKRDIERIYDKVDNIIVCTHVPVFKENVYYKPHTGHGVSWNLGCAYFYNLTLGEYIKTLSKVQVVVAGHTHRRFANKVGSILSLVSGSDYGVPEVVTVDLLGNGAIEYDFYTI